MKNLQTFEQHSSKNYDVIYSVLKEYGTNDIDYVFENEDGSVINIQYNDKGDKFEKLYKTNADFLKTCDVRLTNIKDFYNKIDGYSGFKFIGFADGHTF